MSRGLAYWNDERIAFIRKNFVAVSIPTWVRHAEGPEGEFLRKAGIDKKWITSSGYMSCVSASGTYLGNRPTPEVLEAFQQLPESERAPDAVEVPPLPKVEQVIPSPPEGGLVLKVHARFLHRAENGNLRHATITDFPLMGDDAKRAERWKLFLEPNTEYMWMTRDEWRALIPVEPAKGDRRAAAKSVAVRMARFHLTPKRATTSEGGIVHPKAIKEARLEFVVENVSPETVSVRIEGRVHWGSEYEEEKATSPNGPLAMGFATKLHGVLEFDRKEQKVTRFDMVAPGDIWGRWGDANNKSMLVERPGRQPFGFAFALAKGESPTERIPPGGNGKYVGEKSGYFAKSER